MEADYGFLWEFLSLVVRSIDQFLMLGLFDGSVKNGGIGNRTFLEICVVCVCQCSSNLLLFNKAPQNLDKATLCTHRICEAGIRTEPS